MDDKNTINLELDWVHYITMPYTLFSASVWYHWYESKYWTDFYNLAPPTALFVEQSDGLVRQYWTRDEFEEYNKIKREICVNNRDKILSAYLESDNISMEAGSVIKSGGGSFRDLKSAVEYLCKIAFYTTILPFTVLETIDKYGLEDEELLKKSYKLRSVSYYPDLLNYTVLPLVKKYFDVISYKEILSGSFLEVKDRVDKKQNNYNFVLQYIDGKEKIFWVEDSSNLILSIEGAYGKSADTLAGVVACRGRVVGNVRVILHPDKIDTFKKGEILVTTNSNPIFMPAIKKAAAIITDEGGLSCHAAIISRELGIPCIIGTNIATQILKDGDEVEVDAEKGIVRKILK